MEKKKEIVEKGEEKYRKNQVWRGAKKKKNENVTKTPKIDISDISRDESSAPKKREMRKSLTDMWRENVKMKSEGRWEEQELYKLLETLSKSQKKVGGAMDAKEMV